MTTRRRQVGTVSVLVAVIVAMVGLTAASVPLYRLFCQVTGYGGTPSIVSEAGVEVLDEMVTVRFNADVDPELPWVFRPVQRSMDVHLGEQNIAVFEARNLSDRVIAGTAVFNVAPLKIGGYFSKIACFCFDEQVLQPGESVDMPVSFYVDPAMLDDPSVKEVHTITLSYTFFEAKGDDKSLAIRTVEDEPDNG